MTSLCISRARWEIALIWINWDKSAGCYSDGDVANPAGETSMPYEYPMLEGALRLVGDESVARHAAGLPEWDTSQPAVSENPLRRRLLGDQL